MPVKSVNRQRKTIHFRSYETKQTEKRAQMRETEQVKEREKENNNFFPVSHLTLEASHSHE